MVIGFHGKQRKFTTDKFSPKEARHWSIIMKRMKYGVFP